MVAVRDRYPPILAERLGAHAHAGRRLPALVLGEVDEAHDAIDEGSVVPGCDELGAREVVLDVAAQDRVEHLIGRQRIVVALIGPQLG